ncbi:hypothetical protein AVEN_172957-1 [Araneus ventricosus]|uniref:Tesmin/TSO1-like CXC domain-containing protein n=1 Tax=Araneus ventricosus TaxID=182803 RepID=A0A4Y2TL88_ARAVE|nr:hypothetical protein AVEN_6007-1 [Araneus ventricosus]GBO00197.1 hypothetical protein AVEN_172957-1 [Araneus ventricosus]
MSITKSFEDELQTFFKYELAPHPLSLFDAIGMRKTQKSAICDCFQCVNVEIDNTNTTHIIDGGYLLHRVDIKVAEQRRRTTKISLSSDVLFDRFMTVSTNQQQFLANTHKKSRFISMLSEELKAADIFVKQVNNDADVLVIETALEKFNTNTTIVVGEDVDLLIILTARIPTDRIIYFLKPGKAQIKTKMYSSQSLTSYTKCQAHMSFLHAITGCDTTSAFFKRGKTKVFKLFEKRHDLIDCAEVFTNIGSSPDIILTNGTRFLLAMYGAPKKIDSIDKHRFLSFVKNTRSNKRVQLSCLPQTSAAAYQHLYRVYYQVQVWLDNELDPENWGWVLKDKSLEPIQTLFLPTPEKLLNTIFCNCKKGCNYNYFCKKGGLFCSQVCSNCQGKSCSNIESNTTDEDTYDINEEISDPSFFLEQSIEIQQQGGEEESEE